MKTANPWKTAIAPSKPHRVLVIDERDDIIAEYDQLLKARSQALFFAEEREKELERQLAEANARAQRWEEVAKLGYPQVMQEFIDWKFGQGDTEANPEITRELLRQAEARAAYMEQEIGDFLARWRHTMSLAARAEIALIIYNSQSKVPQGEPK